MSFTKRALAELIGTFWLVLGGCGSAISNWLNAYAHSLNQHPCHQYFSKPCA